MMEILFFFGTLTLIGLGIYWTRRSVRRQIDRIPDHERWMN